MGEKIIVRETLPNGAERVVHVDKQEGMVFFETGSFHPVTGEALLRFASHNVEPYLKLAAQVEQVEPADEPAPEPADEPTDDLEPEKTPEPAEIVETGLEFETEPESAFTGDEPSYDSYVPEEFKA
jgi:hypothetical protein